MFQVSSVPALTDLRNQADVSREQLLRFTRTVSEPSSPAGEEGDERELRVVCVSEDVLEEQVRLTAVLQVNQSIIHQSIIHQS